MYTTMIATVSSNVKFFSELWNALAVSFKAGAHIGSNVRSAVSCTSDTACPNETPGFRLNETVTDGSWPE